MIENITGVLGLVVVVLTRRTWKQKKKNPCEHRGSMDFGHKGLKKLVNSPSIIITAIELEKRIFRSIQFRALEIDF